MGFCPFYSHQVPFECWGDARCELYDADTGRCILRKACGGTIVTGSYVGNNTDDRQITTGFKCSMVIIQYTKYQWTLIPSSCVYHADSSPYHHAYGIYLNLHATDGFVVGDVSHYGKTANKSGDTYYYWAISE